LTGKTEVIGLSDLMTLYIDLGLGVCIANRFKENKIENQCSRSKAEAYYTQK
jgi:hypothetical protein